MVSLVAVELFKIRKRRMTWVLGATLAILVALVMFMIYVSAVAMIETEMPESVREEMGRLITYPNSFWYTYSLGQGITSVLMIILAASMVGGEYSWGTVRQVLITGADRGRYLLAQVAALMVTAFFFLLLTLVVGTAVGAATTSLMKGEIQWGFLTLGFVGQLLDMFWRAWYALLPYVLLAVALAVLGRSSVPGIAGGLVYYFAESVAISIFAHVGWLTDIQYYTISHNASAVLTVGTIGERSLEASARMGDTPALAQLPSLPQAVLVLLAYSVVFLAVSLYVFKKRDVMP